MKLVSIISIIFSIVAQIISRPTYEDRIVFPDQLGSYSSEIIKDDSDESIEEQGNINLESGSFFQGDIELSPEQELMLSNNDTSSLSSRTGLLNEDKRWHKNKKGHAIMAYIIDDASYTNKQKKLIERAMRGIEKNTCIRFVERTHEEDYVYISTGGSCSSNLGMIGGRQRLTLNNPGCMIKGTIQHELIHAIGYDHMHCHIDRDRYVEIKWENIDPGAKTNFETVHPKFYGNFNTTYDLFSVMHYHSTAFSKNGKDTIVPKSSKYARGMGQRIGISSGDVKRINRMYKCSGVRII